MISLEFLGSARMQLQKQPLQEQLMDLELQQWQGLTVSPWSQCRRPQCRRHAQKGPSLPAMSPAAIENTTPISFATSVLTCTTLSCLRLMFQSDLCCTDRGHHIPVCREIRCRACIGRRMKARGQSTDDCCM